VLVKRDDDVRDAEQIVAARAEEGEREAQQVSGEHGDVIFVTATAIITTKPCVIIASTLRLIA